MLTAALAWLCTLIGSQSAGMPTTTGFDSSKIPFAKVLANFNVPDGLPGLAIASPSRAHPNYYFHWIRDGAIAINSVTNEWLDGGRTDNGLAAIVESWIEASQRLQTEPNLSGNVGEPKFYVNGTAFWAPWGRPQNDGPALRVMALLKYAKDLHNFAEIYRTVVRRDLAYIAQSYENDSFDLWEELHGQHFFTALMQWGALKAGAVAAAALDQTSEASQWAKARDAVASSIQSKFLAHTTSQGAICEHSPCNLGGRSGLDAATVLAVLELRDQANWTIAADGLPLLVTVEDTPIQDTVQALRDTFRSQYPINYGRPGGIGRYPEDAYDGDGRTGGNPWFLCTAAVAEAYALVGRPDLAAPHLDFINKHGNGTLSEQANRETGFMQGAGDLTWSYTAVRRANQAVIHVRGRASSSST